MGKIENFLLVDEDEANTLFFSVLLKDLGYENSFTETNPKVALGMIKAKKINFVISAWEMDVMPGTVFVQKAKNERRNKHMPCLIYSKRMSEEEVTLVSEMGIKNILSMPFDRDKATDMIREMIDKEENLSIVEQRIRQMEALIANNQPGEALKLVDHRVTKKSPQRPHVRALIGEIWVMFKKYDKAEASLKQALDEDPEHHYAKTILARMHSEQGNHQEAIKILEEMSKKSPKNIGNLLNLGASYAESGDNEKAKETLNQVSDIDEDNTEVNDELGKIAFKEGDMTLAEQLFAETENGNELARFFNNMAIGMVASGDFDKGIETYQNAIKLLSDKAKLQLLSYNLGLAYRKKGDVEKALETLSEAYITDPSYEKAYVSIARLVLELKEQKKPINKEIIAKIKEVRSNYQSNDKKEELSKAS